MDLERLGAYLGLAAFLGLAILVMLVIQQARDVRRLRQWAGRAPEQAAEEAEESGEEVPEPEHGRISGPLIRFGARLHDRGAAAWQRMRRGFQAADRRSPIDLRILSAIFAVAALVVAGLMTGGFGFFGEETAKRTKARNVPPPEKIEVAVLNGTAASGASAAPGLATDISKEVKKAGYKLGKVGDTSTQFIETVVMFEPGEKAAARRLAGDLDGTLGRTPTQSIIAEVRELAGDADLVLVLGQDDAPGPAAGEVAAEEAPTAVPEATTAAPTTTAPAVP